MTVNLAMNVRRTFWPTRRFRPILSRRRLLANLSGARTHLTLLGESYPVDSVTNITPSIVSKTFLRLHTQPSHPLSILRTLIEAHFPDYAHLSSLSPIVSPFKNFDELSFPKDHPGRSITDSYYINKDLMLRTHTSAHEVEVFGRGETKWLLTADVYRRDEIDGSHYPVFHQMEGARLFSADASGMKEVEEDNARLSRHLSRSDIIIEDIPNITPSNPCQISHDPQHSELVAVNLKLALNNLILALFGGASGASSTNPLRVRWIEAYFPFTSPSFEVEVFFRGKWLEILGSGVVRQATLDTASLCPLSYLQLKLTGPATLVARRGPEQDRLGFWSRSRAHSYGSLLHPRHSTLLVD